ncbi:MAG: DoxX family membrane protein, partial [Bacteroidota bacterium]
NVMNKLFHPRAVAIVRILFGINFVINGLNPFVGIYELPPPSPAAESLASALIASGYLFTIVKIVEIAVGVLLLVNRFVPLALILIFPISLNIFLFDTILEPAAAPLGIAVLLFNVYLCTAYLKYYRPFLVAKAPLAGSGAA